MFKMLGSGVVPVLFFLIIAVIMQFILVKTAFGRNLSIVKTADKETVELMDKSMPPAMTV